MVSGISAAAGGEAASFIGKKSYERRTLNFERPTSNTVFCQLKKILNHPRRTRCAGKSTLRDSAVDLF
jgi:hypothetical protein